MSNFVLPDLQGRVALCVGQSPGLSNYVLGQASGYESASMLASQMPSHGHGGGSVTIQLSTTAPNTEQPNGNILASPTADQLCEPWYRACGELWRFQRGDSPRWRQPAIFNSAALSWHELCDLHCRSLPYSLLVRRQI